MVYTMRKIKNIRKISMSALPYYALGLLAISCYASLSVLGKKITLDIPPYTFITITMLMLAAFSFIAGRIFERDTGVATVLSSLNPTNWAWLILFAFINFVGFSVFLYVVSKIPVVEYQLIGMLMPVIGGLLAIAILGEPMNWRYLVGIAIAAVGIFIALKK